MEASVFRDVVSWAGVSVGLRPRDGDAASKRRSVVCVTTPICPASTPTLVTAWMAVAKVGVIPRKATLEAPMLPANHGKCRRRTSRMRPAPPSSERRHRPASPASRRQLTDASSVRCSSARSRHRRTTRPRRAATAWAMPITPEQCLLEAPGPLPHTRVASSPRVVGQASHHDRVRGIAQARSAAPLKAGRRRCSRAARAGPRGSA